MKVQLYTETFDESLFKKLKDELEDILNFSNITPEHLQDEILGPRIIKAYKKLETEKRRTDGYYMLLMGYSRSLFRNFENYHRMIVGLDGDGIQLILR